VKFIRCLRRYAGVPSLWAPAVGAVMCLCLVFCISEMSAARALGAVTWGTASYRQSQLLHVDLRALAEGAHVKFAWAMSGDPVCVADHSHPVPASNIDWIRRALRTAWMLDGVAAAGTPLQRNTKTALA